MKSPEEQADMIKDQVISKIHWGATDREVREWLGEKHRIFDDDADSMIEEAFQIRAKEIRSRAIIRLVLSVLGIAIVAGFFTLPLFAVVIFVGIKALIAAIFMIVLGYVSLVVFFRSLGQLLTGRTFGAVDK